MLELFEFGAGQGSSDRSLSWSWKTPFLEYSSIYLGADGKGDLSDCGKLFALNLFNDCSRLIPTMILLVDPDSDFYDGDFDKGRYFSGLHWASVFVIVGFVTGLMEVGGCDINEEY